LEPRRCRPRFPLDAWRAALGSLAGRAGQNDGRLGPRTE
jgi:hypothetical protein